MRKMWRKLFGTAALACMLCLTGLVMSGEAQARFTDNGDGTVTDTVAQLMWTKNADPFGALNWHDAMSRCSSFGIPGFGGSSSIGGWRLPSKDELVALYHAIQGGHPFTGVQSSYYWSSTTSAGFPDVSWGVYMAGTFVHAGYYNWTNTFPVWPVRDAR